LLFLVTEDWYFVSHRLELAIAARDAGYDVSVATRVDRHGERIAAAGLKLYPLSFNRGGLNPIEEMRTLAEIRSTYLRERPDIVHHVSLKPVIYGSLVAKWLGISCIVNALGGLGYVFSSTDRRARMMRRIVRPILRLVLGGSQSVLIVQNRGDRDRLVSEGLAKAGATRLIRGAGVDPNAYRRVAVEVGTPLVILPARLLREKGVCEFVEAARLLRSRGVQARFALVGKPDPANPASLTEADVEQWAKEGVVECWGWRDDMPDVFAMAQIVCLPSYHEGFPKSLLEAAASGCAIVASDIPGCREIVAREATGWLVPVGNVAALAVALQEAIERPDLRTKFGAAARSRVEKNFSIAQVTSATLDVYSRLIGISCR
jgi:glycosyltransferase involved in cell wall biosynthesis